jgi:[ribosomal protein S5]-alanine N-acetyltransferase
MTPVLMTERLLLRPLEHEDAADMAAILGEAAVAMAMCSVPMPFTPLHAAARILMAKAGEATGQSLHWVLEDGEGDGVGIITLVRHSDGTGDLGFAVAPGCQGQGYATEALSAAFDWLSRTGFARRAVAEIVGDGAAGAILHRLGFAAAGQASRWSEAQCAMVPVAVWSKDLLEQGRLVLDAT